MINLSVLKSISFFLSSVLSLLSFYRKEKVIVLLSDSSLASEDSYFLSLKH